MMKFSRAEFLRDLQVGRKMIVWCAYCQKFQGESPPFESYMVTHGICIPCEKSGIELTEAQAEKIERLRDLQSVLFKAGTAEDIIGAEDAILTAQTNGVQRIEIVMGIISPLLWKVGELWACGKITIADEHRYTAFFEKIISKVRVDENLAPGEKADILLLNSPGNYHILGIRVLQLWLLSRGVRAWAISECATIEEVCSALAKYRPRYLGISVALAEQLPGTQRLITEIREALGTDCPELLVGGGALKTGNDAHLYGAIALRDARDIFKLFEGRVSGEKDQT